MQTDLNSRPFTCMMQTHEEHPWFTLIDTRIIRNLQTPDIPSFVGGPNAIQFGDIRVIRSDTFQYRLNLNKRMIGACE